MKRYVVDASALVAFLDNRSGAAKIGELFSGAVQSDQPLFMSVVNWGEVYYVIWRARGEGVADEMLVEIARLPIETIDADVAGARLAATLKARFGLPYADCFAAALAISTKAVVVTADTDFKVLKDELELSFL